MARQTYPAVIGSQRVELPVVPIDGDLGIALLITVDLGIAFCARAGEELGDALRDLRPDAVVSIATMGIPVAIEVARRLGQDGYVVLHKTPKIHLHDAVTEPVHSITTAQEQRLLLDRWRVDAIAGRRVAIVDDVDSTGASAAAALRLLRRVDAEPVAIGALATEGQAWRAELADDAPLVRALGTLPLFRRGSGGGFEQLEDG